MKYAKYVNSALVCTALAVFAGLCLYGLDWLAPRHEEAVCGLGAAGVFDGEWLSLGDPFMRGIYGGRTKELFVAPFILFMGQTVFALRFAWVFYAVLSLGLIYRVTSLCFGKRVGLITLVLLSCNSSFIRSVRLGGYREEAFQIFLFWTAVWLLGGCLGGQKKWRQYLAFFVFGVALWAKIMFLGYAVGLCVACLVCSAKMRRFFKFSFFHSKAEIFKSASAFVLGALPFLVFNIYRKAETVYMLLGTFVEPNQSGWNNRDVLHNIVVRAGSLLNMLMGTMEQEFLPVSAKDHIFWIMFVVGLGVVLAYLFFARRRVFSKNRIKFVLALYTTVFLLSSFIPRFPTPEHLIILVPFIEIVCALGAVLIWEFAGRFKPFVCVLLCVCGLMYGGFQFRIMSQVYAFSQKGMGMNDFSSVIYDFSDYLQEQNARWLVSLSLFVGPNVRFLSKGRILVYNQMDLNFDTDPERISEYPDQVKGFYDAYIKGRPGVLTVRRYDTANQDGFMAGIEKLGRVDNLEWVFIKRFESVTGRDDLGLYITRFKDKSETEN